MEEGCGLTGVEAEGCGATGVEVECCGVTDASWWHKGGGTKVVAQKVVEMVTDFCLPEIACKKTIVSFICRNLNNKFAMCAILDFSDSTRYPLRSSQMLSPFGQGIREPPAK